MVPRSEVRLVVRCRGGIDTVVEVVWMDGDLGVVGWIYRINMVTAKQEPDEDKQDQAEDAHSPDPAAQRCWTEELW